MWKTFIYNMYKGANMRFGATELSAVDHSIVFRQHGGVVFSTDTSSHGFETPLCSQINEAN